MSSNDAEVGDDDHYHHDDHDYDYGVDSHGDNGDGKGDLSRVSSLHID